MRIVLTGGGTGGHVIPNVAVIEGIERNGGAELLYIGSKKGPEKKIIEGIGVEYREISCGKLRRYFSFENFVDFFRVFAGIFQAKKILEEWKPDVVFSKGGYVSLPVVFAARRLKIPVVLHESDLKVGLANKMCMRFADKICVSFEETLDFLGKAQKKKAVFTGNPVRREILSGDRGRGFSFTDLSDSKPIILVIGGSQGAMQINSLIWDNLPELLKKYQIVHIVGDGNLKTNTDQRGYVQYEYLNKEMKDIYAISDIVLSRGGANSLTEIALLGKKAIIIPLSTAASRGDQVDNAKVFVKKFGWSMLSGNFDNADFMEAVNNAYFAEIKEDASIENGDTKIVEILLNR